MSQKLDHPDFVYLKDIDPNIILIPRYATKYNFTGRPMRGYQSESVVVSKALGEALSRVQKRLDAEGYTLVVYDAYRPHKAVESYL
jgi:D-alanyl-D-alanine dipeptidase